MSVEFKWSRNPDHRRAQVYEPVEVDESFKVVFEDKRGRRNTISNGRQAFDVIERGALYDKLISAYLSEQARLALAKPKDAVATESLRVTQEPVPPVALTVEVAEPQSDEESEQEFLNAIATDERQLYEPLEDEWFSAHIVHRDWKSGKYLLLELSTGDIVYCPWQRVTHSPGNHTVCLPLGTECSVRIKLDRDKYWALETQVDGEQSYDVCRAQITSWHGSAGSAYRECGCPSIFVVCPQEIDESTIQLGDWVEIIHRPSEKRGWVGFIQRKIDAPQTAQGEI